MVEVKELYFSVEPEGVIDICRQMCWYENKRVQAIEMLKCFDGITEEQIKSILAGDATITSDYYYIEKEDLVFKNRLKEYLEWKEAQYIKLAGYKVPKGLLEEYAGKVIRRLRQAVSFGRNMPINYLTQIPELERIRTELHEQIIAEVGLTKSSPSYWTFQGALTDYVDNIAGKLTDMPTKGKLGE